jgi:adenosylcobinamide-phosphate synthase
VYLELTFAAYLIDRVFGEFKYITHPIVLMGKYITWFEKHFYKDSFLSGAILTVSLILIVWCITYPLSFLPWYIQALLASMAIASKMLYESVKDIINNPHHIKYLVSRDTNDLSQSDINKAAIETYAENLSDGVIAPLFYLLIFGIMGVFIYKAINTLDSMVGYKNDRYNNFGKVSAKLDDIANFIPSRITAVLIALLFLSYKSFKAILNSAHLHESPNAGYPIAAMAGAIKVQLGGDTSYFGTIKHKPYFGTGSKKIEKQHITQALDLQKRLDLFIISALLLAIFYKLTI